jgi:hypothetical protein
VRQQIANADWAVGRDIAHTRSSAVVEHFDIGERRDVLRDRVAQLKAPFLEQHQYRRARDWLGHGVDAKQRIVAHGRASGNIGHTAGFEMHRLAAPRHQRNHPGQLALVDITLHHSVDPAKSRGRESLAFGANDVHVSLHFYA